MPKAREHFDRLTVSGNTEADAAARLAASIAAEIERIMRERMAYGFPTYRLAQVGNALGPELRRLERLTGRRLADIVREDLGYAIVVAPERPDAPFIGVDADAPAPPRRSRIPAGLWQAFTTALPPRMTRVFAVADGAHRDGERPETGAAGLVPVSRHLIHPAPPRHLFDAVSQTILAWAEANGIDWPAEAVPQAAAAPPAWIGRHRADALPFRRRPGDFVPASRCEGLPVLWSA